MTTSERRKEILDLLSRTQTPLSATAIAQQFSVSRQIIVGDIALLRAGGAEITATPRGYVLTKEDVGLLRTVAVQHSAAQTEQELCIFVDNGCTVEDVIVEHHIYGQIIGQLHLASRYDVSQFLERLENGSATVLSSLTDGIHLHTLRCPNDAAFDRTKNALKDAGILLETE